MAKEVPKANDEALGIAEAERNTYWCNFAMVREDYQGKGVAKALFEVATKEVRSVPPVLVFHVSRISFRPPRQGLRWR